MLSGRLPFNRPNRNRDRARDRADLALAAVVPDAGRAPSARTRPAARVSRRTRRNAFQSARSLRTPCPPCPRRPSDGFRSPKDRATRSELVRETPRKPECPVFHGLLAEDSSHAQIVHLALLALSNRGLRRWQGPPAVENPCNAGPWAAAPCKAPRSHGDDHARRGCRVSLYGPDPLQKDVAPGALDAKRVAIVRAKLVDASGNPLGGVKVTASGTRSSAGTRPAMTASFRHGRQWRRRSGVRVPAELRVPEGRDLHTSERIAARVDELCRGRSRRAFASEGAGRDILLQGVRARIEKRGSPRRAWSSPCDRGLCQGAAAHARRAGGFPRPGVLPPRRPRSESAKSRPVCTIGA